MKKTLLFVVSILLFSCNSGEPVETTGHKSSPATNVPSPYAPDAATRATYASYSSILIYDGDPECHDRPNDIKAYPVMMSIYWPLSYNQFLEAVEIEMEGEESVRLYANRGWHFNVIGKSGDICKLYGEVEARNEWEAYGKAYVVGAALHRHCTVMSGHNSYSDLTEIIVFAPEY